VFNHKPHVSAIRKVIEEKQNSWML